MAPTHINFSDVSAATVPDGTTATAANTGLQAISNQSGTAVWGTDASGRRYIEGTAGDRQEFTAIAAPTSDYFAIEWELEYSGTPNTGDIHSCMDFNEAGFRMIQRHRTNSSWNEEISVQAFASGGTTASPAVVADRSFTGYGRPSLDTPHWYFNFGYKHASNGFLGFGVNGQARFQSDNIDTSAVVWGDMTKFIPMDGSSLTWRLYGVRYWSDDTYLDELKPDWNEAGYSYQFPDQIGEGFGPWEVTSGAATFDYDSSGISPFDNRMRCSSMMTLEMRDGHAFGTLKQANGRACIRDEFIALPASGSYDLRLGTSSAGDIGIIAFDGTSGTSTTRPIKIGGVATGLVYEDSEPYCLDIIFDETTNKSALVLTHIGSSGATDRRQWGVWWNRTGGIPEVNIITRTLIGADATVGMMQQAAQLDYTYPSSYHSTNYTLTNPSGMVLEVPNHLSREFDMVNFPALRGHKGILSNTSIGRTGNRFVNLTNWTGGFATFEHLRGQRFFFGEQCINDFADGETPATILAAFQLQVDAAVANGVKIHGASQPLLSAPTYDDDYRTDMDEVNEGVRAIMVAANRPDLFSHADVRGQYASQAEMDSLLSGDDTHYTEDGRIEVAGHILNLLAPVGVGGQRSRDRSRER